MGDDNQYGLLIAAIVAIVSIVGLVIIFSPVGQNLAASGSAVRNVPAKMTVPKPTAPAPVPIPARLVTPQPVQVQPQVPPPKPVVCPATASICSSSPPSPPCYSRCCRGVIRAGTAPCW